ncbi:M28 family peptidase [Natrarchaeobius oligotrophus]|uniref:Carboxypeptidase Q n=1 Tax=Natrarchaeobius chitinivorans TaxID=1679083 RepID=A0A3N6M775_NATCH|nr:M28 family peptidase [Natrarchaeobius chitinivorans]RQG99468.1 M28 family peptidase [Natrarchaeobius chitinivorans]
MTQLPHSVVGKAYTSTNAWETLVDLVEIGNRMPGHEGEKRGAEVMERVFTDVGLRGVSVDPFDIPGWWRGSSSLSVDGARSFDARHEILALPGSPSGTVAAPIVDVGDGLPEEFERTDVSDRIVVASSQTPDSYGRWVHRMEKYACAAEAGAAGFVFRNHIDGCLPPTGEIGYHDKPDPIPAVGVSKEVGSRLRRYCADGGPEATLTVDCRNEPARSRNVEGVLGPDTDGEILLTAHVDAHDISDGAIDNAVGCAIVAEVARLLTHVESSLGTRVRFVCFGSEETGLHGAYHWLSANDPDSVEAILNVDLAGDSRTLLATTNGFDALADLFEDVGESLSVPVSIDERTRAVGDQWAFVQRGIPSVLLGSVSERADRGWGHTHADTLDKIDDRDVRALVISIASAVLALSSGSYELQHKSPRTVAETVEPDVREGLVRAGVWKFDET